MVAVKWAGYPRSYTKGRRRKPQYVTLHYTAGSEGPTSAEAGVAYDKIRTDGTSAHYYTDSLGPALQEVPEGDRAHTARFHGNEIGIHIEICGTRQTREQWLDGTSLATLRTTAALVADICRRQGFPMRRLTTAQTRAAYYAAEGNRPTGINDHNAISLAYPEDGGDHTDVGAAFPWDVFMEILAGGQEEEADVAVSYKVESADPAFNGRYYLSNGVNRRGPIRQAKQILTPARAGTVEQVLTDAMRTSVSASTTWPQYLDAVAGPEVMASADKLAAAVVAALPAGALTKDDVEAAVRAAFERGLAPDG